MPEVAAHLGTGIQIALRSRRAESGKANSYHNCNDQNVLEAPVHVSPPLKRNWTKTGTCQQQINQTVNSEIRSKAFGVLGTKAIAHGTVLQSRSA